MEEMRRLAVGQSVSGGRPMQEGFELRMGGGPALVLAFRDLTPGEVEGVRSGEAWFGVAEKEGVLFFLFRIEGLTDGWADSPYHRALEEEAFGPLTLPELSPGGRLALTLVLLSAEDGVVRALRFLSLSPRVSEALLRGVKAQGAFPADYDERLVRIYARFSSEDLAREGVVDRGGA